jgi:hypothetical protein
LRQLKRSAIWSNALPRSGFSVKGDFARRQAARTVAKNDPGECKTDAHGEIYVALGD